MASSQPHAENSLKGGEEPEIATDPKRLRAKSPISNNSMDVHHIQYQQNSNSLHDLEAGDEGEHMNYPLCMPRLLP